MLVLVTSAALCAAMYLGKSALAAALTNSREVQEQLKQVLPLVVATIICECDQGLSLHFYLLSAMLHAVADARVNLSMLIPGASWALRSNEVVVRQPVSRRITLQAWRMLDRSDSPSLQSC
jgi:hypothetical protein